MTAKLLLCCAFTMTGSGVLFAQAPASLHTAQADALDLHNTVRLLEQNALLALIGAVGLMAMVWLCSVINACKDLNKPQKNTPKPFTSLLILVAGLSVFCGSCSVAQQARVADIQAARAAEGGHCVCPAPFYNRNYYGNSGLNNRYPNYNYSNDTGRPFCRQCGQRIYDRNR